MQYEMEFKELKRLSSNPKIMADKLPDMNDILRTHNSKVDKLDRKVLIKKIENSRLVYNRKEPILTALKRTFILANKLEDTLDAAKKFNLSRNILIQAYMKEYNEVSKFPLKKLDSFVVDKNRLKRFNMCKWSVRTIDVKDLGVWPSFGGMDRFTTSGNLLDTKEKIMDAIKNTHKFRRPIKPNLPERSLRRFVLEKKHADLIYRFYPIIVTAKGPNTRRIKMDKWARKNLGFGYEITPYDIEDGSHRAMSFAMFGIRKIKCFVGTGLVTDSPSKE
jgi:hypothetical protein